MGERKVGARGRYRRLAPCAALVISVVLGASVARAEERGFAPLASPLASRDAAALPDTVVVTLRSEDAPVPVELYNPKAKVGTDLPIARCTTPCFARVPQGRYRLFAQETPETLAGGRMLDLDESTAIVVSPDDRSQRTTGLALGIGGSVAMIGGALLALSSICIEECTGSAEGAVGGLLLMAGGMVVTPIGWTMFARSFKPDLTVTPLSERAALTRRSDPIPRGARLGFTVSF